MSVQPITRQPGSAAVQQVGGALEQLVDMDYVRIKQKLEWCEICCCNCCETENSYTINNVHGVAMFTVKEESCFCCRYGCDANRPLDLYVKDPHTSQVLARFARPLRCGGCCGCANCCCCCLQKMEAYAPEDVFLGAVTQQYGIGRVTFDVNADEQFHISGPRTCCTCTSCGPLGVCCCRTVGYNILKDGEEIGLIRKEYSGMAKEVTTDADNFYITFPKTLSVSSKLTLISAVFLLDYMFFEHKGRPPADNGEAKGRRDS